MPNWTANLAFFRIDFNSILRHHAGIPASLRLSGHAFQRDAKSSEKQDDDPQREEALIGAAHGLCVRRDRRRCKRLDVARSISAIEQFRQTAGQRRSCHRGKPRKCSIASGKILRNGLG